VIFAIGQKANPVAYGEVKGLELTPWGTVRVDEEFRTSIEGLFAGGDVVNGGDTVVRAIAHGRSDGKEAVKLLYPPFRDALMQDVKVPLQLTEMKPSEMLACVLSSMGENIKKIKVLDAKGIDDKHWEVIVKVIDKNGMEKILAFITIKDEKRWKIASISNVK
jgi:hypothetical protein